MSQENVAVRETQVGKELNELQKQIEGELFQQCVRLRDRLSSVLKPEVATPEKPNSKEVVGPAMAPLAGIISELRKRIGDCLGILHLLEERLEIP